MVFPHGNVEVERTALNIEIPPAGIWLDVGCGDHKHEGTIGMDRREVQGVDIVHDLESIPYPLPDECCRRILASHIVEHLNPAKMVSIMDEWWRLMKPYGQLIIAMPYAGSPRFHQDPTHIHAWNETTPSYFDPAHPLYDVYKPKPWHIDQCAWHSIGDLEVILSKIEKLS